MPPKKDAKKDAKGKAGEGEPAVDVAKAIKLLNATWDQLGAKYGCALEPAARDVVKRTLADGKKVFAFENSAPVPETFKVLCMGLLQVWRGQQIEKLWEQFRKICFWSTHIGDDGFLALAELLKFGSTMYLELMNNELGPGCGIALGDMLATHGCRLISLTLDFNQIGSAGAVELARGVSKARALETLTMTYCAVESEGGVALASVGAANCTTLKTLNLAGNRVGNEGLAAFGELLKTNTTLETLDLSDNCIGSEMESLTVFRDGLAMNSTVATVDVANNLIGEQGALLFQDVLQMKANLRAFRITTQLPSETFKNVWRDDGGKKKKGKKGGKKKK